MIGFELTRMRAAALAAPFAILVASWAAPAQAQIWRCENADGVVEYSNSKPGRERKDCRQVDLPNLTTIPAPAPAPAQRAQPKPDFPKVDSSTQRARDEERRQILERELRKEEERLAALETEYKGGEPDRLGNERNYQKYLDRVERLKADINRAEANVASIRREIDALPR